MCVNTNKMPKVSVTIYKIIWHNCSYADDHLNFIYAWYLTVRNFFLSICTCNFEKDYLPLNSRREIHFLFQDSIREKKLLNPLQIYLYFCFWIILWSCKIKRHSSDQIGQKRKRNYKVIIAIITVNVNTLNLLIYFLGLLLCINTNVWHNH